MTNILDTVEPDGFADWLATNERRMHCGQFSDEERMRAAYDAGRASTRKQVLLEAAEVARSYEDRFGLTGEDDYQCGRMRAAFDITHELRRMAEGEKHE